ncbi:hypothetical protein [Algicella marina]|uniref:Uncharacterized protein n=1 Tax=Algicella marina TaxID=2683284 RepID=A0A6P1SU45_9RHOB|nr:hypothetical protein [Algicella marina]QHQ33948.1 hypothetical protein GO499_01505 [Algicella marina]
MLRWGLLLAALLLPQTVLAMGPTERACLQSERSPGRQVCACAQSVADQTLSKGDQDKAAGIIRKPDLFFKYHGSDNPSRKAFLQRYRAWGTATSELCGAPAG